MKNIIIIMLLLLILVFTTLVVAECQYKYDEEYNIQEKVFYQKGLEFGRDLNLSELVKVELIGYKFKVINNLEVPITLYLKYNRRSDWFGINTYVEQTINIKSNDFETITDSFDATQGCSSYGCSVTLIKHNFIQLSNISTETDIITKTREICSNCNEEICFNDGDLCSFDYECGSGICSIANNCSQTKIVSCTETTKNCNNEACLTPSIRKL